MALSPTDVMGLGRGGAKGEEGNDSGQMVVGTGVTMDYSAVDDGNLTVRERVLYTAGYFCEDFLFRPYSVQVNKSIKERQKYQCQSMFFPVGVFSGGTRCTFFVGIIFLTKTKSFGVIHSLMLLLELLLLVCSLSLLYYLTLLELQSRFGDKPVKFQVVCPQHGTAVRKGLITTTPAPGHLSYLCLFYYRVLVHVCSQNIKI